MWFVSIAMLVVLLPFWLAWLMGSVRAMSDACTDSPAGFVVPLGLLTLPWLFWLFWLWRTPESRKPRTSSIVLTWGVWVFFLFVIGAAIPGFVRAAPAARQASAVGSLRTMNTAEFTYAETYHAGFSRTLDALAGPPPGSHSSSSAAGLIDNVLATGRKNDYTFTYRPGSPDAKGIIQSYTVTARPGCKGAWNLFTDQSGILRKTSEDRAATANDRGLDE